MMTRRNFLKYLGLLTVAIAIGVGGYVSYFQIIKNKLAVHLQSLFDISFKDIAENIKPRRLLSTLRNKGVIGKNSELNISVIRKLAKTDQVIEYKDRYYTQTEIELYSLAYLLNKVN